MNVALINEALDNTARSIIVLFESNSFKFAADTSPKTLKSPGSSKHEESVESLNDESIELLNDPALGKRRSTWSAAAKKINYFVNDSDHDGVDDGDE
jgi:glycerol dehydrogenase-like iron-containing ADH family enzyme